MKKLTNEKAKEIKQVQNTNHKASFMDTFGAKKVTFSEKESKKLINSIF